MTLHRRACLMPACLMLPLLAACFPSPDVQLTASSDLYEEGGSPADGLLSQDRFKLTWEIGDVWDTGHCVDLELTNLGRDIDDWELTLRMDAEIQEVTSFNGIWLEVDQDLMVISPCCETALECNDTARFQYCGEPAVSPLEIMDITLNSSADGGSGDGDPVVTWMSGPLLLSYSSDDSECWDVSVTNASDAYVDSWSVDLTLADEAVLTGSWGFTPLLSDTTLTLYPQSGSEKMSPFQSRIGSVCLEPLVAFTALSSHWVYGEPPDSGDDTPGDDTPGDDDDLTTPTPVPSGSLSDEQLHLWYEWNGEVNDAECLGMTIQNASGDKLGSWKVTLAMSGTVNQKHVEGDVVFWPDGNILEILPKDYVAAMDPYATRWGRVCMDPLVIPESMTTEVTISQE